MRWRGRWVFCVLFLGLSSMVSAQEPRLDLRGVESLASTVLVRFYHSACNGRMPAADAGS